MLMKTLIETSSEVKCKGQGSFELAKLEALSQKFVRCRLYKKHAGTFQTKPKKKRSLTCFQFRATFGAII